MSSVPPDRNLALELVRVTEAAALSAARLVGQGDKEAADQAAVDGMHAVLHTVHMDGDVSGSLLAVAPDRPADLLWGIGGTPEGVISAAALKCYGGGLIGRLWPRDDEERKAAEDAGYDVSRVLTQDDLVQGDNCFFCATGVTDGDVLEGVRYEGSRGASTESLVMRSRSGTVRRIQSRHDRDKLRALTGYRL